MHGLSFEIVPVVLVSHLAEASDGFTVLTVDET
jgi:hypothetical protein